MKAMPNGFVERDLPALAVDRQQSNTVKPPGRRIWPVLNSQARASNPHGGWRHCVPK